MTFQVQENGKPCDCANFDVHSSWRQSVYSTFEEARDYYMRWLGPYAPNLEDIKVNEKYDYNGYGCVIEIVHIESF